MHPKLFAREHGWHLEWLNDYRYFLTPPADMSTEEATELATKSGLNVVGSKVTISKIRKLVCANT